MSRTELRCLRNPGSGVTRQRDLASVVWTAADGRRAYVAAMSVLAVAAAFLSAPADASNAATAVGRLSVTVTDGKSNALLPCRVHLTAGGKVIYAPGCPRYERDADFCCDGRFEVDVPAGPVEMLLEKGPEWPSRAETLNLPAATTTTLERTLERWIDMNAEGWFSGDLHVHRPPADVPLLMRAEDLNVAPVLTHWNQQHLKGEPPYLVEAAGDKEATHKRRPRVFHTLNQEDERIGGAILLFNLREPILRDGVYRHWPSGMAYHRAALGQPGVHVEVEKPFWWEAPVHVALGKVSSIGIVHNHYQRRGLMDNEAWGRARDTAQYPGPPGFCRYTLDLYYRYLNLGWEIAGTAGSASGVLQSPLGYSRTYVRMDAFDYGGWWEALRAGRNVSTNGPMIFATVNDQPVGARFAVGAGESFDAIVRLDVRCRDPLDRAEIVVGGKVAATARPLPGDPRRIRAEERLSLDRSSWIAVRAFQTGETPFRFAHTSPFYVRVGDAKPHDPEAARFFVQWIDELIDRMKTDRDKFRSEEHYQEVIETYGQARAVYARLAE